jgi:hypothetical protein
MVIVVVRWYIKKGDERRFQDTWEQMIPKSMIGLFRELFSKPIDRPDPAYHTLDFESSHYTTYINVGIWRGLEDFDMAIGSMIPARAKHPEKDNKEFIELFDFEYKLRERIVMDVVTTRGGQWEPPTANL